MNKTRAYTRLKKKQKQTLLDWAEPTKVSERIVKLPLRDLQQLGFDKLERINSNADISMFGLRNLNALKNFIEVVDLEKDSRPELSYTSLPNISSKQRYYRSRAGHCRTETAQTSHQGDSESSVGASNGYTLLQAKLDALILPTPIKRKASRSYSGSSTGFHGRKMSIGKKENSVTKPTLQSKEEDIAAKECTIQFPIASKMRQLLTIDPVEQPSASHTRSGTSHTVSSPNAASKKNNAVKEVSRAARFYFPNYAKQKQKTVTLPLSNSDLTTKPCTLVAATKSGKGDSRVPKQVSFVEDTCAPPKAQPPKCQQATAPEPHLPSTSLAPESHVKLTSLVLSTKNLEMYNTLTMTSDLGVPSADDSRVASWVKDRQQWTGEMCDDIPEVDEIIASASPQSTSSQITSICG